MQFDLVKSWLSLLFQSIMCDVSFRISDAKWMSAISVKTLNRTRLTFQDVPSVEFKNLAFTRMPGESYRRRLGLCCYELCDVCRALMNSLVCWFTISTIQAFTVTRTWSTGSVGLVIDSFFSRVDFLCWLLFRYPFHTRVTAVACKRSRSFCQKCRWQVTAKHA